MILSATLKRDAIEGDHVRYVDTYGGTHSFLSEPVLIKSSDLPDPPPALLRVDVSWYQSTVARPDEGVAEPSERALEPVGPGDHVLVVKSRTSGVQNPPEWLRQHMGKTGVVRWVTIGGANVDLGTEVVWFAYDELEKIG